MTGAGGYLERPAPSGLADVVEVLLDRGIVIDAYVRVSLLGIELVTIDARVVIASVDTYLRFAEATNRLELRPEGPGLTDLVADLGGAAVEKTAEKVVARKVEPIAEPVRGAVDVVSTGVEKVKAVAEDVLGDHDEEEKGTDGRG